MAAPYFHLRAFWGAFDLSYGTPQYTGAAIVSAGSSAASGSGVGVRRAELVFDRLPPGLISDDVAAMHFDFLNLTAGAPDDTWTAADFASVESSIGFWWGAVKALVHESHTLREIRWYRVGTGVVPPNPAARVTPVGFAGTSSSQMLPPQIAVSLTMKTARRLQWGRTYLPGLTTASIGGRGILESASITALANALDTLITSTASNDFHAGVLSKVAGSFFTTESIQVDNIADVIRRRRWRNPTQRVVKP
jgi:hypothetical protein